MLFNILKSKVCPKNTTVLISSKIYYFSKNPTFVEIFTKNPEFVESFYYLLLVFDLRII